MPARSALVRRSRSAAARRPRTTARRWARGISTSRRGNACASSARHWPAWAPASTMSPGRGSSRPPLAAGARSAGPTARSSERSSRRPRWSGCVASSTPNGWWRSKRRRIVPATRTMADDTERIRKLVEVVRRLRSPQGCPWDREQTHASLRATMLEEAYEVLEAIDELSIPKLREELGDVLLQVLMQSDIAAEAGDFTVGDVADAVREKLVRRHPHVFGQTVVSGSDEVVRNWEALKAVDYGRESALAGVQRSLPALQWAWSLQRRAANVGFDWPSVDGALDKVREELEELREAPTVEAREAEFGDLLFTLVNVARKLGMNPEDALRAATGRFEARFRIMEQKAKAQGQDLKDLPIEELDQYWEAAKRNGGRHSESTGLANAGT